MHQFAMVYVCRANTPRIEYRLVFHTSTLVEGVVISNREVGALVDEWAVSEEAAQANTMQEKVWSLWAYLAKVMKTHNNRVLVAHVSTELFGETYAFEP